MIKETSEIHIKSIISPSLFLVVLFEAGVELWYYQPQFLTEKYPVEHPSQIELIQTL